MEDRPERRRRWRKGKVQGKLQLPLYLVWEIIRQVQRVEVLTFTREVLEASGGAGAILPKFPASPKACMGPLHFHGLQDVVIHRVFCSIPFITLIY